MRYAKWKINFSDNPNEGTGPDSFVISGTVEGGFEIAPFEIVGYLSDDVEISEFHKWEMTELSQEQALELALESNKEAFITEAGRISIPYFH